MFPKSLLALSVLALSSTVALGAPALSCSAASTVTVVASSSSSVAAAKSTSVAAVKSSSSAVKVASTTNIAVASSVAATTAAAATTSAASTSTGASFGKCSTPEIKFAAGLDGRRETAFAPVDLSEFPLSSLFHAYMHICVNFYLHA